MSRIKYNLILIILTILALIAPDFLSQLVSDKNHAVLSGKFIIGLSLFSIALSFTPRLFILTILTLFIFIEVIQFCNLFYYGTLITSSKFRLLFSEIDEVWLVAKEAVSFLYLVPLLILIPYGTLAFIVYKLEKTRIKSIWAIIPVLLLLAIIPFRVSKAYHGENYYPDPSDHSLRNSLYAVTNCLYNLIYPAAIPVTNYKEYQIESINNWDLDKNSNIILIIGESANYSHMSLFGYERDTNPLLSTLKTSPNFTYLKGLSSGVSTPVSLAYLINNIYEPNNMQEIENKTANLFRLAKQHDFKTFYISAQSGAFLTNMGVEYIDYKLFRNNRLFLFKEHQDEALLKIIPNLDYTEKNFIVIHQRNAHAPYEENYEHNSKFNHFDANKDNYQQFRIDTYDNATLYNDFLIYKMIQFYKEKFNGPTYIFFTSDHGEVLDSNKVAFGHAELKKEVAEVPFLAYIKNAANEKIKNIKEPIFHYEISNLIIELMGFKIINPNQKPNIFYIHGTELDGHNEFIEYHK
ncbi:MAG: phosphoethanolamine transferase [Rickettsiales bacterium]